MLLCSFTPVCCYLLQNSNKHKCPCTKHCVIKDIEIMKLKKHNMSMNRKQCYTFNDIVIVYNTVCRLMCP